MSSTCMSDIQFRIIQNEDRDCVLEFLRMHFYPHEPINVGSEPKQQDPRDERFLLNIIPYNNSVMAVKTNAAGAERVLAVAIAGPKDVNEAEHLFEEAAKAGPTKWGHLLKLMAFAERDSNVYERYDVTEALHCYAKCVDAAFRGKALGASIMNELIKLGRKNHFKVLTTHTTSVYSARVNERVGMKCINVMNYKDYLDEEGNQVFCSSPPHDECVKTYAVRL